MHLFLSTVIFIDNFKTITYYHIPSKNTKLSALQALDKPLILDYTLITYY